MTTAQPPKTILKLRPSGWRLTDAWCNGRPWGLRASVACHRRLDEEVTKNIYWFYVPIGSEYIKVEFDSNGILTHFSRYTYDILYIPP